jgi:AbrB family looped-hinge helix DNA binding protein
VRKIVYHRRTMCYRLRTTILRIAISCNRRHMESALTSKGQATIPKAIREHLRLKPGDRVKFFVHPDGGVVINPL